MGRPGAPVVDPWGFPHFFQKKECMMTETRFGKAAMAFAAAALIAGPVLAQSTNTLQNFPIKMGTSGGSVADSSRSFCCGGTLGALVNYGGQVHILSNNHVVARSGSAVNGEDIIQPGLIDVGCRSANANIVADFIGDVVPLGQGNVDAALARPRANTVDLTGALLNVGIPCAGIQTPTAGLAVAKSGRTTGYTTGTIQAVNVSVNVGYQKGCNSGKKFTVSFTIQFTVTPGTFSAGGDSGSLIVSNDGTPNPVGLLFAGSSAVTIGSPAQTVANAFGNGFSFVGQSCGGAAVEAAVIGLDEYTHANAKSIKERVEADFFERPGVVGIGVGRASDNKDSLDANEAAIVVYVETAKGKLPKGFPSQIDGVKVRLIATDAIVSRAGCN
jgi:hypothetical protein